MACSKICTGMGQVVLTGMLHLQSLQAVIISSLFIRLCFHFLTWLPMSALVQSMSSVCLTYSSRSISPSCITCSVYKLCDIPGTGKLNILFRLVKLGQPLTLPAQRWSAPHIQKFPRNMLLTPSFSICYRPYTDPEDIYQTGQEAAPLPVSEPTHNFHLGGLMWVKRMLTQSQRPT